MAEKNIPTFGEISSQNENHFDKRIMHSDTLKVIKREMYGRVFNRFDRRGEELSFSFENEEFEGFCVLEQETGRTYFIDSADNDKFPLRVTSTRKIKMGRKILHYIDDFISFKGLACNKVSTKELIDNYFPLKSTHPDDLLIGKLFTFLATVTKSHTRILTKQGGGKDGMFNTIQGLTGYGFNVTEASDAKLAQSIERKFGLFNEIAGYSGAAITMLQRFFLATAATNVTEYEHTTTGSDKTRTNYDISYYGFNIAHNITEYYLTKGKPCFEQMFSPAVFYRIFPIELEGQIDDIKFSSQKFNAQEVFENNKVEIVAWIGKWTWLRENFDSIPLRYDISKYNLIADEGEKTSRWLDTFLKYATLVQEYTGTDEKRFWEIMDLTYKRHKDYIDKIKGMGLI